MKVAIVYGDVPAGASQDEQDVLTQAGAVAQAVEALGHTSAMVPLSLDLGAAAEALQRLRPQVVFNLVETVQGRGHYIHLGPTLLEGLQLPYTGATTVAMLTTSNKLLAKRLLTAAGLPTPPWLTAADVLHDARRFAGPYIVKSVWEHGSIGLDDDAVISDPVQLEACLERRNHHPAAPWFVERYVPGREFNLSLLAGRHGPELLPPAEIEFVDYPPAKARIVGYRAKWVDASFEYRHTHRRFDFPAADTPLLASLGDLALACWRTFDLRGYARVDLRVDEAGQPWILEVNANPCLTPDSGFVAAAARAGWPLPLVVERIIAEAQPVMPCYEASRRDGMLTVAGGAA